MKKLVLLAVLCLIPALSFAESTCTAKTDSQYSSDLTAGSPFVKERKFADLTFTTTTSFASNNNFTKRIDINTAYGVGTINVEGTWTVDSGILTLDATSAAYVPSGNTKLDFILKKLEQQANFFKHKAYNLLLCKDPYL